jgi:hypothetical protein
MQNLNSSLSDIFCKPAEANSCFCAGVRPTYAMYSGLGWERRERPMAATTLDSTRVWQG